MVTPCIRPRSASRCLWLVVSLLISIEIVVLIRVRPNRNNNHASDEAKTTESTQLSSLSHNKKNDDKVTSTSPSNDKNDKDNHNTRDLNGKAFLAFVRVPKTASSSVVYFLAQETHANTSGLRPLNDFLDKNASTSFRNAQEGQMTRCVLGKWPQITNATSKHSASAFDEEWDVTSCLHVPSSRIQEVFDESIQFFPKPNKSSRRATANAEKEKEQNPPHLQFFSVVREPFDRLKSLFHYVHSTCNIKHWEGNFTPEQYEHICDGDFEGFLRLVHTQGGGKVFDIPNQYRYFDLDSVDTAIARIQGDSPEVFLLLTECFEESLRIMETKFKHVFFQPGAADRFLQSSHLKENVSEKKTDDNVALRLRESARSWFADDYKFYDAAVEQFRQQVQATKDFSIASMQSPCNLLTDNASVVDVKALRQPRSTNKERH